MSLEFFPPKTDRGVANLLDTVDELEDLNPDFVSVTYGAGGSTRDRTRDLVVSASPEALSKMLEGHTRAVVSCTETPTADFTRNRNWHFPLAGLKQQLLNTLGPDQAQFIDAQHLATALMGDALYANMLLLGYAWQQGLVPVSAAALDQAIELNGAAVAANRQAFLWGRRAAVNSQKVAAIAGPLAGQPFVPQTLDELIASRITHLTAYQDAALAKRYQQRVEAVGRGSVGRAGAIQAAGKLIEVGLAGDPGAGVLQALHDGGRFDRQRFVGLVAERSAGRHFSQPFITAHTLASMRGCAAAAGWMRSGWNN